MEGPNLRDLVNIPAVWDRLERVEQRLYEVTEAGDPFLTKIAQHLLGAGGKRYRPLVAEVAAELGTADGSGPIEAGVAVELVHLGSLYHDDVIDEAETRRSAVSVNTNWSNTIAILAGDFLLARASEVAAPLGEDAVILLASTYATLVRGQVLELQLTDDLAHGPDEYYRVIGGKTASLIQTSARLGAMAAEAAEPAVEAAGAWAWEMGIVFQLTDDVLDLVATPEFMGKPAGSDINEGTFTLPVLLALQGPNRSELETLLSGGHPFTEAALARIISLVNDGGHVDEVVAEARQRLDRSEEAIAAIDDPGLRDMLSTMGRYLLTRVEAARLH